MIEIKKGSPIILGSGSPRRKEILELAGIDFEVKVPNVEENFSADINPEEIPVLLAARKAKAVQTGISDSEKIILTADTIVIIDGEVLGKPSDSADAVEMLKKLSGRTHQVISGVCILKGSQELLIQDETLVTFDHMHEDDIMFYVDTYQPFDKAGAYAIQEWIGVRFISKIEGCYYNVMGLPLSKIVRKLNWER